jgi:hypothetical protein
LGVKYYKHAGFVVDVQALVGSRFKRWVAKMDVREIVRNHQEHDNHDDITGDVVIIGGIGVVDGFRTLRSRRSGAVPVLIFELRNAERFIFHHMGPKEKDKCGMFKRDTIVWHMRNTPDLEGWKR